MQEALLLVPYAHQRLVAEAHAQTNVLEESHGADGTTLRLRGTPDAIAKLRAALAGTHLDEID